MVHSHTASPILLNVCAQCIIATFLPSQPWAFGSLDPRAKLARCGLLMEGGGSLNGSFVMLIDWSDSRLPSQGFLPRMPGCVYHLYLQTGEGSVGIPTPAGISLHFVAALLDSL